MAPTRKLAVKIALAVLIVTALGWLFLRTLRNTNAEPYRVESSMLSGWKVVAAERGGPAIAALEPVSTVAADLFRQLFQRNMQSMVAPARPSMPLVLRREYEDSLQGVHGLGDVTRIAQHAGLESASFTPVCMARRRNSTAGRTGELYFVLLESPAFVRFRQQLRPLQPEHAGTVPFEPAALRPVLTIAATDEDFSRWWPVNVNDQEDCVAPLVVSR